jgi:hypothetical protein
MRRGVVSGFMLRVKAVAEGVAVVRTVLERIVMGIAGRFFGMAVGTVGLGTGVF